jgi:chromosome segregation ATPase
MDEAAGEWCTYEQAGERLRVSPAAVRARALRGGWRRTAGNDGKARVLLTQEVVRAAAEQPRDQPRKAPIAELAIALRAHVETLKGDVARLEGELAHAQANADHATAELKTDIERLTAELAAERTARQADQEQLAAARAAADRATAELVELARRLAAIAETQTAAETAEAEPEPPRRSAVGRAWRWFLRN